MSVEQHLNLLPEPGEGGSVLFVFALKRILERSSLPLNQSYLPFHLVQLKDKVSVYVDGVWFHKASPESAKMKNI